MIRFVFKCLKWLTIIVVIGAMILGFTPLGKAEASDTLYEYYNTGADEDAVAYGDLYLAQTFTPQVSHDLTSVKVKLYRVSNCGNVTVALFATSGGIPTGYPLRSGTITQATITEVTVGAWYEVTFSSSYQVASGTKYAIVVGAVTGDVNNNIQWLVDSTSPTYTRGTACNTFDGGITWTAYTSYDCMFEEYGTAAVTVPTVTTEAVSAITGTTATGNATITSLGGGTVTKRGIVYSSTDTTPTIAEGASYVGETGTFTAVAYTESLTGLSVGVTYYVRGYAYNSAGYGYGNVVSFTTSITAPAISSVAASNIAKYAARLNAIVQSDGGESCQVRFGYGDDSPATFANYDTITDWVYGYTTSQAPYVDIAGLTASTTYYFSVQIKNSHSTVTSTNELTFTTVATVLPVSEFKANPDVGSVYLSWIKGEGSSQTAVRYSFSDYPALITDGYSLYSGAATDYEHAGLTSGTIIYYTAWAFDGADYSTAVYLMATTKAGVVTTTTAPNPMESSYWFQAPDYTNMSGVEPIYTFVNGVANDYGMPYGTAWVLFWMAICAIVSLGTWLISGSPLAGSIMLTVSMGAGVGLELLQFWMVFFGIIMIVGVLVSKRDFGGGN